MIITEPKIPKQLDVRTHSCIAFGLETFFQHASPLRGKGARIDGVQAFGGKIAMFSDRKILASLCFARRVELLPVRQGVGRDQQYPRASGQELTLNKQGAQGARCAVQLRGERWSVLGSSGTADQPSVLRGLISSARAGTNRAEARAGCRARTWAAARGPQTIYSSGMREPSAVRPRLRLPCRPASRPTPAIAR